MIAKIYTMKNIIVTPENIEQFKSMDSIRNIRKTQVERLKVAFLNKDYLEATPMHVNFRDNEYRVIDGNHRLWALREIFDTKKAKSINLVMAVYENLSNSEEKDIYDLIAKQVPQNTNDFLSLHRTEFPIWEIISKKSFPCKITIYGSKDSVQLKTFLYMLNSIKRKKVETANYLTRDCLLSIGKKTKGEDYDLLSRFIRIFMASLGIPGTENKFSKLHIIVPLFHVWYYNKDKVRGTEKMMQDIEWAKRFELIIGDPEIVLYLNSVCTRETIPAIRKRIVKLMSQSIRKSKFKLE